MPETFFIEVSCSQRNHEGERICGDVFVSERIPEENRIIAVLSDGMGHGVKANVLATLTATMALRLTREHESIEKTASVIMKTLPECSIRKMSYSTFTVVDIKQDQQVRVFAFGNADTLIFRGNQLFTPEWVEKEVTDARTTDKTIRTCTFTPVKEDRIIVLSDGVVQSGLGSESYPGGWGIGNIARHISQLLSRDATMSASKIASRLVNVAVQNDHFHLKDDSSCLSIYLRNPRRMMVCTGPPFDEKNDAMVALRLNEFEGVKVICGATTAEIMARELSRDIIDHTVREDPNLPPTAEMEGIDLITEGILTLSKVSALLERYTEELRAGKGPADKILQYMMLSDEIEFLVGTRINTAHQDPAFPEELEIRRTLVRRIARTLEKKLMKKVEVSFY